MIEFGDCLEKFPSVCQIQKKLTSLPQPVRRTYLFSADSLKSESCSLECFNQIHQQKLSRIFDMEPENHPNFETSSSKTFIFFTSHL